MILGPDTSYLDVCDVCEQYPCTHGRYDGEREENGVLAPDPFRSFSEAEFHFLGKGEASGLLEDMF